MKKVSKVKQGKNQKTSKAPGTKEFSPEIGRYLGALNEAHSENLKAVKEGFSILDKKLDEHSRILDSHTEMFVDVNRKLDEHSRILDSHTEMIGELKLDVSVLKNDMQIVKGDISIIKTDLKKRVDYDEFMALVKRVNKLEAKI